MPKGIYKIKIKDYQLVKLEDDNGVYYQGIITNRKNEEFTIYVDEKGKELLENYNWQVLKCNCDIKYLVRSDYSTGKKKLILFHRAINNCPDNLQVDHLDHNGLNNRLINLRNVNHQENHRNRSKRSDNTSGYIGISFSKKSKKWQAEIMVNGKRKWLGYFKCPKQAAIAYNKEAVKHGYLNLNIIE